MRCGGYATVVGLLSCSLAGSGETRTACSESLNQPLQAGAVLMIDSKPAGLRIVGTDEDGLRVSCTAENEENARDIRLHFAPRSNGGKLTIAGAHSMRGNNNLEVTIEVPRRTNLRVRMFAGEIRMEEVKGDKDVEVGAGQITISPIHDGEYRSVDASVMIGEVQAQAWGTDKGGFFRRFSLKKAGGDYRLHAHVTTGEIDLRGHAGQESRGAKPD